MCCSRVCERIATLTKLGVLDISGIYNANAALQLLTTLTKLSSLRMADARCLSTSSIARSTMLIALDIRSAKFWVGATKSVQKLSICGLCLLLTVTSTSSGSKAMLQVSYYEIITEPRLCKVCVQLHEC